MVSVRVLVCCVFVAACAPNGPGVAVVTSEATGDEAAVTVPGEVVTVIDGEAAAGVEPVAGREAAPEQVPNGVAGEDLRPLPASVAVVGDSLTLSAADDIEQVLRAVGLDVVAIDGVENRRMVRGGSSLPPGIDAIDEIVELGESPELWIIALGTNDVGSFDSEDSFGGDVRTVLSHVPAGVPVIWIDLWIRDRADEVARANEVLRTTVARRVDAHVVDWYAFGDVDGIITRDGVHLTERGQQQFADSMAAAVNSLFVR